MENQNLREELQVKYKAIEAKIKELETVKNQTYKTSCQFRYNPTNSYSQLDINTTTNVSELINANAFIQNKKAQYHDSAEQLELNTFPVFKWCGYEPDLWLHDIKLRLAIINLDQDLYKLKELKSKIQPYLPEDNKIKQLLLEIPTTF